MSAEVLACSICGAAFNRPHRKGPKPKYCSDHCRREAHRPRSREQSRAYYRRNKWKWAPKKVTLECPDCGIEFERQANRIGEGKCRSCSSNRKRAELVERECRACGKTFQVRENETKRGGGVYCSRACWKKEPPRWSEEFRGEHMARLRDREGRKNPNYRHGNERVRRVFNVTAKGEFRCRACGATENIHLHHAIPRSMSRAAREDLRNGIPLCAACHMGWHMRGTVIYRDRFTYEEWSFISSVPMQGFNLAHWLDQRYPDRDRPFHRVDEFEPDLIDFEPVPEEAA